MCVYQQGRTQMTTNEELIREIRKPGKVYVTVIMPGDVARIVAEKADLIAYLSDLDPKAPAPWTFVSGRTLDAQGAR